jgi:hypothetical protein
MIWIPTENIKAGVGNRAGFFDWPIGEPAYFPSRRNESKNCFASAVRPSWTTTIN